MIRISSVLRRKQKSPHGGVVGESRFGVFYMKQKTGFNGVFYMKQKTGFNGVFAPNKAVLPEQSLLGGRPTRR